MAKERRSMFLMEKMQDGDGSDGLSVTQKSWLDQQMALAAAFSRVAPAAQISSKLLHCRKEAQIHFSVSHQIAEDHLLRR